MRGSFLVVLLACACAGAPAGPAGTTAVTSTGEDDGRWTTGLPLPTTGTATTTTTTTTGTTGDSAHPSIGWACDPRLQDCPPGEKCTPYSSKMDSDWDGARCVPVVDDPAGLGEPASPRTMR